MSSAEEQPYKVMKRVKDSFSAEGEQQSDVSVSVFLPTISNALKSNWPPRLRSWRASEDWTSRSYMISLLSLLCIFVLSGFFMFAYSLRSSYREPDFHLGLSEQNFWASGSGLKALGDRSTSRNVLGSEDEDVNDGKIASGCDAKTAKLKLFMYDLPPKFHYGMLVEQTYTGGQIWPKNVTDIPAYPGGLYQQHSPEYWLTNDLLTSSMADRQSPCTAFRVSDWREADLMFIPFFASLAYNKYTKSERKAGVAELDLVGDKNQKLQENLLTYLRKQPAWQAHGGRDHILVIHHPNSMYAMRDFFRNVMYVVADFGRYAPEVANIEKDIVAPYKHVIPSLINDTTCFEDRDTLLFFQGTIHRKQGGAIRQQLYEMLNVEKGVHFEEGLSGSAGIHSATTGMRRSKFCLNIAGDTPSSNRLFDAIASHCVPVIISDDIEVPFEDELDYSEFCIFIKSTDALREKFLINFLRSMKKDEWTVLWRRVQRIARHFEYQHPTKPYDAVNMIWRAIARRIPTVKLLINKKKHFSRSRSRSLQR